MSPRFDFQCPNCHMKRPDVWVSSVCDAQGGVVDIEPCVCGTKMEKVPAAPNFTIKGFSAKNGYSK